MKFLCLIKLFQMFGTKNKIVMTILTYNSLVAVGSISTNGIVELKIMCTLNYTYELIWRKRMDICICMTDSLCCTPKTNTF